LDIVVVKSGGDPGQKLLAARLASHYVTSSSSAVRLIPGQARRFDVRSRSASLEVASV
jgi:hypothetical protein